MTLQPASLREAVRKFRDKANANGSTIVKYLPILRQCFEDLELFSFYFDSSYTVMLASEAKDGQKEAKDVFMKNLDRYYRLVARCLDKFEQLDDKSRVDATVRIQKYTEILLLHLHGNARSANTYFNQGARVFLESDVSCEKLTSWFERDKRVEVPQGYYNDFTPGETINAKRDFDRFATVIGVYWD